jgi:hypothetical protein
VGSPGGATVTIVFRRLAQGEIGAADGPSRRVA